MELLNFEKGNGLVPVIIQHRDTMQVLMLGYMDEEAFIKTKKEGKVTFYSRSKGRLWTKGETSGNHLEVCDMAMDCDQDTLLIKALPAGPVCHTGSFSCFGEEDKKGFLYRLESIIEERINSEDQSSYTRTMYRKGMTKMAQKVGEEAVELVIEAMQNDRNLFLNEGADLIYHLLLLLKAKGISFEEIEDVLHSRHKISPEN